MHNNDYKLAPKISYRVSGELAMLLDHGTGDVLRLNPAAGRVLRAIETGGRELTADELEPLHCQLEVTYRCTLACRHCYVPPGAADPASELTVNEIGALLDQLAELGTLFLLLTGGEPFARPDLEVIFDAARDRRFAVSLLTSGAGADREVLQRMAARGVDSLQVSLYGPDAATHDRITGADGSFDAALHCLRTSRDLG
ncbi:MAG: radical SAM protein, partial [Deltaproteobacteria bacterium]|nr:radical SAM protein [Deltaproteobacteria bacterium]